MPELNAVGNPKVSSYPGEILCIKELERELMEMDKYANCPFFFLFFYSLMIHVPAIGNPVETCKNENSEGRKFSSPFT